MSQPKLATFIKYGIYAVAFMPLIIFSQFLSPFHFGKVIIFRIWMEILGVLYLILIFRDRSFLPRANAVFWIVTIFTLAFGLTTLTSPDRYQSFWGTLERMGGWFTFAHFWLFFVIAVSVVRKREEWLTFAKLSVIASLLSTFYGFLQKTGLSWVVGSGGRARIFGTLGNPALFAGYELLNVFLALFFVFSEKSAKWFRWFCGLAAILDLVAIFSTAVRGSILAALAGLVLFVFLLMRLGGAVKLRRLMFAVLALMLVFEFVLILNRNASWVKDDKYFSRLSDISLDSNTVRTRFWAWQAGLDGWNDSVKTIIFGWGPENFNLPFSKHFNPKFYEGPGSETLFDRGHNMFIEVLVTMGLIGLLGYLSLFLVFFKVLQVIYRRTDFRDDKLLTGALACGLAAYIIHNAFIFDTSANLMAFFLFSGLIYFFNEQINKKITPAVSVIKEAAAMAKNKIHSAAVHLLPSGWAAFIVVLFSLAVVVSVYKTDIRPAQANYATTRGIVASWGGDHAAAVEKFKQALSYEDVFIAYEIRHRVARYAMENLNQISKDPQVRESLLISAIEEVKKNIRPGDLDYLPYLYISRTYILLGQGKPDSPYNDLALQNGLRALEISPTFVRTYYEVAQAYLNKGDLGGANQIFRRAVELNPSVAASYWYWGITELDAGNFETGWAAVKEAEAKGYSLNEKDYGRVINVLVRRKDFVGLAEIYPKLIALNPNNPQYYASLATAYQVMGDFDKAEEMARQAVKIDSTFEHDARIFIESLGRQY